MNTFGRILLTTLAIGILTPASGATADSNATAPRTPKKSKTIYHDDWIDFNKNGVKDVYEDRTRSIDERVEDLLSQMTLEEKTCQMVTLYGTGRVLADPQPTDEWLQRVWKDGVANIDEELNGVGKAYKSSYDLIFPYSNHVQALQNIQRFFVEKTRLGIPAEFSNEGIHGLNHTKATPLPSPIALGSTWDRELIHQAGSIAGMEAKLLGYHSVYAPILDVARDQRWGRTLECYGEDPYIVAQLGAQMAKGIQEHGVASGLKHYAAYGVPKGGRDGTCRTDPHITPRELHEIFLYPFREVIAQAHPMEVMSSYNDWNGEPVSASHYFLTELLRETYGFDGYVVSDSEAVEFVYTKHQVADSYQDAVRQCVEAGLNVRTHFTKPEDFVMPLRKAIEEGQLSQSVVDQRVREVLKVKFRLGLFDNPYTGNGKMADELAGADKHEDFVLKVGAESMVLLKNDGILPLDRKAVSKVLVTGPLAAETNYMSSRYGPNGLPATSMVDGIREYLSGSAEVLYEEGCKVVDEHWPQSEIIPEPLSADEQEGIRRAVEATEGCDVVIAVMGEDDRRTGESRSRTSLDLPGRQRQLLMSLYATGKPVILVLVNGQPLTINWEDAKLPAILETWFPNCEGGKVLAQALFGDINPSGKLTITFPKTIGQIEYNFPYKKGSHGAQSKKGPNGSGNTRVHGALYPFGHGLSYTTFEYSDLKLSAEGSAGDAVASAGDAVASAANAGGSASDAVASAANAGGSADDAVASGDDTPLVRVSATITNTGKRAGDEVVQLYVRDCYSSVVTYDSVLRGFERVSLQPGESRKVEFTLCAKDLQILDKNMKWTVEPGDFEIRLGASSTDIRLKGTVTL